MSTVQSQKSVMVVDDDPSIRKVVSRALKSKGYRVRTASNGSEALTAAAHQHFDMMFLDIIMPGISGLDVLYQMGRRHPNTVVVMLTAIKAHETQEKANLMDAFTYLTKPCRLDEITTVADSVLCG